MASAVAATAVATTAMATTTVATTTVTAATTPGERRFRHWIRVAQIGLDEAPRLLAAPAPAWPAAATPPITTPEPKSYAACEILAFRSRTLCTLCSLSWKPDCCAAGSLARARARGFWRCGSGSSRSPSKEIVRSTTQIWARCERYHEVHMAQVMAFLCR